MNLVDFVAKHQLRASLGIVFLAALALTVIAFASVAEGPRTLATMVFALLVGFSAYYPIGALAVGRVQAVTIIVLACLLIYVVMQILPFAAVDLANGAWKSVNDLIGPVKGTISIAPGMTLGAISSLALPFLVFLGALVFFQGDDEAPLLWRVLAYFRGGLRGLRHIAGPVLAGSATLRSEEVLYGEPHGDFRQSQ